MCVFSSSFWILIVGRVLQEIGAAGIHSITMALTRHSYPRSLFGRAAGLNSSVVGLSMAAGPSVGALILPDLSPAMIGLLITPWPAGVAMIAVIAGRLSDRYSQYILCTIAMAVLFSGLTVLLLTPEGSGPWDIAWRMLICGVGFGLFTTPNNWTVMLRAH